VLREAHHNISFSQPLCHLRMRAKVPFMHFDIQITLDSPHCPSSLRFPQL
jgi:hypothetical protein